MGSKGSSVDWTELRKESASMDIHIGSSPTELQGEKEITGHSRMVTQL